MTWFSAFRGEYGYTYYGEKRTPVTVDVQLAAVVYACVLISIATLIAAAGIRGKERWYTLLRVVFSLAVGSTILLCIFGFCWQSGTIDITSPYIYRSDLQIKGTIGLHIGLRKINITLTGIFGNDHNDVNYNEEVKLHQFPGPLDEITHCLRRGLPQPVLNIVEYVSVDAGNLRWGRSYTIAGYFTHILLWVAFSFWILGNIMISSVVFYGAFMATMTGVCMVLSTVVFHVLQPTHKIRLSSSDIDLNVQYGICYWAVLIAGILTVLVGLLLLILDYAVPKTMTKYLLLETQFVKEEVFTSQMRRTSSLPYFQQFQERRTSSPMFNGIKKCYSVSDFVQTNPVYGADSNSTNVRSEDHANLKRCSTSPGSIQVTCSYDRLQVNRGSHKTSISSLHSINEKDEELKAVDSAEENEVNTGLSLENNLQSTSENTTLSVPALRALTVDENDTLGRLKKTYISIEPSHKNEKHFTS